MTDQTLLHTF